MSNELFHYGTPRHSGRYPWGSGEDPYQHPYQEKQNFLAKYASYKEEGMSEKEIANAFGLSINDFRKKRSIAQAEEHAAVLTRVQRLKAKGYTNAKIGEIIGGPDNPIRESTIRGWLTPVETTRIDRITGVADILENKVKKGQMIDVGVGSNLDLNVTKTTFDTALSRLKDKGYVVDTIDIEQPNAPSKYTTIKYLAAPGTTKADAWKNRGNIKTITDYSPDGGKTSMPVQYPESISLDRVKIVYKEDGGEERDGMVGIRRNVPDLNMGNSNYAQVRIAVDDKYYIKGMAVYEDKVPKGYDIVVYSNKSKNDGVEKALKKMTGDPENPFGANIKVGKELDNSPSNDGIIKAGGQSYYKSKEGKFVKNNDIFVLDPDHKIEGDRYGLSPINKLKEEMDWEHYRKNLPAQFLSKQPMQLIQRQLDLTYKNKNEEFEDIMSLNNAVVKRKLLNEFAEGVDRTARHLDAAALPRQNSKVIIPIPSLGENEIYAPTYKDGEKLALIRFPHAGRFEIPYVIVNNKNAEGKSLLGNAPDAVGITKAVADKLSGADFDGDTVLTIPVTSKVNIKNQNPLKGLENFDPKEAYKGYEGMKPITAKQKGKEMGIVTNLITDMSLQDASPDEMARAVRHSMVVIDAEKHNLNWKQSERDNGIEALKQKYQVNPEKKKGYGGSSTLLSRLGNATVKVPERQVVNKEGKKAYTPDPETGEWLYAETGRYKSYLKRDSKGNPVFDKEGNKVYEKKYYQDDVSPLDLVKDARELSSGTAQEEAYAVHINKMRSLANRARKEALAIEPPARDPIAAKNYANEVESLDSKLKVALKNKPLERQAQIRANIEIENLKVTQPQLMDTKDKWKKTKAKTLTEARLKVGSGKKSVEITDKEWEAIQARAISPTKLRDLLNNADMDRVRKLATPHTDTMASSAKVSRMKALSASGFTIKEIAELMGCSSSTVSKYIKS